MNVERKWDGKTKGSLWGYRFFVYCIRFFGIYFSYFFCIWVSLYFFLVVRTKRNALIRFYKHGLGYGNIKASLITIKAFYRFGQILIDRTALKTERKRMFSHSFENEAALVKIFEGGKGGFLFSGHVGNWENAGSLIGERITSKINIFMLDAEVESVKRFLDKNTETAKFNLIPLKEDMSHLVSIHKALQRKELVALHADRKLEGHKTIRLPFLNGVASFPAGPFIMAHKFKVPVTFVFAVKDKPTHYNLSATEPIQDFVSPEEIAKRYVQRLEEVVKGSPEQWFNFFDFYAD
ncbi:MAG: lipid A biosynthesis acyltransferase [Bacteroidota bacterium]|jgi:predicted LPLAT superfamily acyltransferase